MAGPLKPMRLRHLARELTTATELALVGKANSPLIEQLASCTGLLVALSELPLDTDALRLWANDTILRAERALSAWHKWDAERTATA